MPQRWYKNVQLQWTFGIEPTAEEDLIISATISTSGPHVCTFKCACGCDRIIFATGRDAGAGEAGRKWIPVAYLWGRLHSGDIIDGRET